MKAGYAISLAVNAALLLVLVVRWRAPRAWAAQPAAQARRTGSVARSAGPVGTVRIGGDWRNWIDTLRAAGVPTEVLAGLVQADFDRRWQSRQSEIQARYMRGEIDADGLAAAGLEHDAELDRDLEAALGPGPFRAWDMSRVLSGLNLGQAQLSDSERGAVYDLERELREKLRQAQLDKLNGVIDQATLNAIEQKSQGAADRQLRALLDGSRAFQLQGMDDTFGGLKRALGGTSLTQAQLDELANAKRQWDTARSDLVSREVATQDSSIDAAIRANDERWQKAFAQIAGAGSLEQYELSQDSRYADLQSNAARWGLEPAQIDRVLDSIQDFEETVSDYRVDARRRSVDPATVDAVVARSTQAFDREMRAQVGAAFDTLEANGIKPVTAH